MSTSHGAPHEPSDFQPDAGLRVLTTLLIILGALLVLNGLTFWLMVPATSVAEAIRSTFVASVFRVAVGTALLVGGIRLRKGSRLAAIVVLAVFAVLALNGLWARRWTGLLPVLIAVAVAMPLARRWRSLA